ncbi:MAG: hypothetical protein C0404_12215 [Verrucomicrobia bacterium]|nr:hypothetical protein [Verrucomicrobiota bacterium]
MQDDTHFESRESAVHYVPIAKPKNTPAPIEISVANEDASGTAAKELAETRKAQRAEFLGMHKVWKGLRMLGWSLGIAGAWYGGYRLYYGYFPETVTPVVGAIVGVITMYAVWLMFWGTQMATPRIKRPK